jgi:hypothetical protein
MKAHLVDLVARSGTENRRHLAREYLQVAILSSLQRAGGMMALAFQGGTALRLVYGLPRWSEDLDFALERPDPPLDLQACVDRVRRDLMRQTYPVEIKVRDSAAVWSALVRFPGLPFELGLSPHRTQGLSVKIKIDTRPPAGAVLATTLVRRFEVLHLQHHDRASLLAGKIHAILCRSYSKGRDLYDLAWYLADRSWPSPNVTLLGNALDQTRPDLAVGRGEDWQHLVAARLASVDWDQARADVRPFLEHAHEEALLTYENLSALVESR